VKFWVLLPVFVQNQQKFLGSTESKGREQNVTASSNDRVHKTGESAFLFVSCLQGVNAIGTLYNENIRANWGQFGFHQVTILFSRVVASIEDFETGNVDQEHASAQDVAGVVRSKADTGADVNKLVHGYWDNRDD
jgi:hypothetical protein